MIMSETQEMSHKHYIYTFGETLCRMNIKIADSPVSCISSTELDLVGGGKNFCSFVVRQKVKHAASKTRNYRTPAVHPATQPFGTGCEDGNQIVNKKTLEDLLDFNLETKLDTTDPEAPSVKRLKIELEGEISRNEWTCKGLKQLLQPKGLVVDSGILEETPPFYSPFYRSLTDLFMYHEQSFKHRGVVVSAAFGSGTTGSENDDDDDDNSDVTEAVGSVYEMKNSGKQSSKKQLHANMIHFGAQLTVKALSEGEIVHKTVIYGVRVQYETKNGNLYVMTMNFDKASIKIEDFGDFPLADAINMVLGKLVRK